jgi:DNA-binding NtrC family response regulator
VQESERPTLLVVEDEALTRRAVKRLAERQGFRVLTAVTGEEAIDILAQEGSDVDVVLVDQGLPGELLGVDFIGVARKRHPTLDYILFTGAGDVGIGYQALEKGATDYFTKPITDSQRFAQVLRRGVEAKRLREENATLKTPRERETTPADRLLIGYSEGMDRVRAAVRRFARNQETVLITGESGVGKDVVARAIHAESGRHNGPYVPVNSAAISHELFESQLFGHVPGAFTGAVGHHRGFFEEAEEGTIFLDEIGDLPLDLQVKLLRVLENRTFRKVGGNKDLQFRGRIIAATNRNLPDMMKAGTFREDLYFRLKILSIPVPPLRDHAEDVGILAYYFAKDRADEIGKNMRAIHPEAMRAMNAWHWPGNVRELRANVLRMVVFADGDVIGPDGLDDAILLAGASAGADVFHMPRTGGGDAPAQDPNAIHFPEHLLSSGYMEAKQAMTEAFARWYLGDTLRRAGGNKTRGADLAQMRRPNYARELKKYDVEAPADQSLEAS